MKIIYQADDGAKFDSEFECRKYERREYEQLRKIYNAISEKRLRILTYDREVIKEKDVLNHTELDSFMDDIYYFHCNDKEVLEILSEFFAENFQKNVTYYFDVDNDMWVKLDNVINNYKTFINNLLETKKTIMSGITL